MRNSERQGEREGEKVGNGYIIKLKETHGVLTIGKNKCASLHREANLIQSGTSHISQ